MDQSRLDEIVTGEFRQELFLLEATQSTANPQLAKESAILTVLIDVAVKSTELGDTQTESESDQTKNEEANSDI